ncbi:MAG: chaperonin GroEL [Pirellulales bacterium]
MAKQILYGQDAREAIRRGVSQVARAGRTTLGPRGRHVIVQQSDGSMLVTKDGVTVVQQIELEDPFENLGARLIRQTADVTSRRAGDGTTTATLLAESIFIEGLKAVAAGINPIGLKQGIELAVRDVVRKVQDFAVPVTDVARLRQVATVASNGDTEIGQLLADVLSAAGEDMVTIEDGRGAATEVEWVDGLKFGRGFLSPYFVTHPETGQVVLENPRILATDGSLASIQPLIPLLEAAANSDRPLLIIARDVQGEALAGLVLNATQKTVSCCAVKAPEFGDRARDFLDDLAVFTGGQTVSAEAGQDLKDVQLENLGMAKRVVVTRDDTLIVGGAGRGKLVETRLQYLRTIRCSAEAADAEWVDRRIAQLGGRVAKILVGARTESELLEKKARLDDALHAAQAAREEGIVPGGGVALLRAAQSLENSGVDGELKIGYQAVLKACRTPLTAIADNAGRSGTAVCEHVAEHSTGYGYDASLDVFQDLMEAGIVDASKVVTQALENAGSLSATLLTSDAVIAESVDGAGIAKREQSAFRW